MGQYGFEHVAKESISSLHWHSSRTVFPTFSSNSQKQLLHSKTLFIDTKLATFGHLQCYILNPIDFFPCIGIKVHFKSWEHSSRIYSLDRWRRGWRFCSQYLWIFDFKWQCSSSRTVLPTFVRRIVQLLTMTAQKIVKNEQPWIFLIKLWKTK